VDAPPTSIAPGDAVSPIAATPEGSGLATEAISDDGPPSWSWLGALLVIAALVGAVLLVGRRRGPRRVVTSTGSVLDAAGTDDVVTVPLDPSPDGPVTAAPIGGSR
jgi:hypothetical protein